MEEALFYIQKTVEEGYSRSTLLNVIEAGLYQKNGKALTNFSEQLPAPFNPTIGLLICREMNRTEVQWAFRNIQTPMGVATYSNVQTEELKEMLPTTEQICELVERTQEEIENQKKGTHDEKT